MDVRFKDASLERLEVDAAYSGGYAAAIVKAFRKRMQQIIANDRLKLEIVRGGRFIVLEARVPD